MAFFSAKSLLGKLHRAPPGVLSQTLVVFGPKIYKQSFFAVLWLKAWRAAENNNSGSCCRDLGVPAISNENIGQESSVIRARKISLS